MRKLLIPILLVGLTFTLFVSAAVFNTPLYKGLRHSDVEELQKFLKNPPVGGPEIYPEGLVTGYFGPLTEAAVQRFQAKYGIVNSGTPETTGYGRVGPLTRAKLNELAGVAPVAETPQAQPSVVEESKPSEIPACRERKVPGEYPSVQSAIDAACEGDTVVISAGDYPESLIIAKENLTLKGDGGAANVVIRPLNTSILKVIVNHFILDGVTVSGDFAQMGLEVIAPGTANITIQNSIIKNNFYGILLNVSSGSLAIKRNLIIGSKFYGIYDKISGSAKVKIENNTIVDNDFGYHLDSLSGTHILVNNIIVQNRRYGVAISSTGPEREHETLSVSYSDVWDNKTENYFTNKRNVEFTPVGNGNLSSDPHFVGGGYQLRSTSPVIDAGDLNSSKDPDGSRADMGAYPFDKSQSRKDGSFLANIFRAIMGLFRK